MTGMMELLPPLTRHSTVIITGMAGELARGMHREGRVCFYELRDFVAGLLDRRKHPSSLVLSIGARCVWPGDDVQLQGEVQVSVIFRSQETAAAIEKRRIVGDMRDDKLVMAEMIARDSWIFFEASAELRSDRDFMIRVITLQPLLFMHVDRDLREDRELVELAVSKAADALLAVPHLWGNEDVVRLALKTCTSRSLLMFIDLLSSLAPDLLIIKTVKKILLEEFYDDLLVMDKINGLGTAPPSRIANLQDRKGVLSVVKRGRTVRQCRKATRKAIR